MLRQYLINLLQTILYIVFPADEEIVKLEAMTPAEFSARAAPPLEQPQGAVSLFSYKDPLVRRALWELKYHGNTRIAHLFAALIHEELTELLSDEYFFSHAIDIVILPIPQSAERRKERGWNQTEMIARKICKLNPSYKFSTALRKIKDTPSQTRLSKQARLNNLNNSFAVRDPESLHDTTIILIDDVTTTGSTLEEARRALKSTSARRILAITIAH